MIEGDAAGIRTIISRQNVDGRRKSLVDAIHDDHQDVCRERPGIRPRRDSAADAPDPRFAARERPFVPARESDLLEANRH